LSLSQLLGGLSTGQNTSVVVDSSPVWMAGAGGCVQSSEGTPGFLSIALLGILKMQIFSSARSGCPDGVPVRRSAGIPRPDGLAPGKERFHIERLPSFEYEVHRPAQLVGQDREGFGFPMLRYQSVVQLLSAFVPPE